MYYCLLRELVYHLNLNYTKFRLAFLEVSSPTGARGSPAHKAIRPHSFAPVPLEAMLPARLDEVAVGDALKVRQGNLERRQLEVVCAQQARRLRLHPSAHKPFDIGSRACGLPTRHLRV